MYFYWCSGVRSCIGHRVDLSCSSFQQFLQTPHGLGAFLKKADGSEDITFCNEKGNCTCMDGCREYKGRLEPGYKSVNMRTVKMEDAELDFMFYFEHNDPRKQTPEKCIFKIDPVVCPGKTASWFRSFVIMLTCHDFAKTFYNIGCNFL